MYGTIFNNGKRFMSSYANKTFKSKAKIGFTIYSGSAVCYSAASSYYAGATALKKYRYTMDNTRNKDAEWRIVYRAIQNDMFDNIWSSIFWPISLFGHSLPVVVMIMNKDDEKDDEKK